MLIDVQSRFFSQVEVQKEVVQKNTAETAVQKKIEKFKAEHTKRITSLQQAEASNERKAHLIEANLQEVRQLSFYTPFLILFGFVFILFYFIWFTFIYLHLLVSIFFS